MVCINSFDDDREIQKLQREIDALFDGPLRTRKQRVSMSYAQYKREYMVDYRARNRDAVNAARREARRQGKRGN